MNYKIDTEAIRDYIHTLKQYQHHSLTKQSEMRRKLEQVHMVWNDSNYDLTQDAIKEIDQILVSLSASLDITINSLIKMNKKYEDYLTRRRH